MLEIIIVLLVLILLMQFQTMRKLVGIIVVGFIILYVIASQQTPQPTKYNPATQTIEPN